MAPKSLRFRPVARSIVRPASPLCLPKTAARPIIWFMPPFRRVLSVAAVALSLTPPAASGCEVALLLAIGLTGLAMRFVAHTDIVAVKAFMLGLMRFDLQPLPTHPALLLHLGLVALLMIVFPISKLLHAPGLFFSPTRNQADTSREARHVAAWAAALDKKQG